MNYVFIAGNLTRDPEMRYTPNGKPVTEFTVAVNEGYGEKKTTEFVRCVSWDKSAEYVAERARKGTQVVIEGRIHTETWKDKETGKNREKMTVVTRSVMMASREVKPETVSMFNQSRQVAAPAQDDNFDDLPF